MEAISLYVFKDADGLDGGIAVMAGSRDVYMLSFRDVPLQLAWPLLTLIAFLAWKRTWPRIVRWRVRRRVPPTSI